MVSKLTFMAAKNKGLSNPYVKVNRRKRIGFNFGDKHKRYIKNCVNSTYNILEGAVRSGKTVDNVFAFAHELKTQIFSIDFFLFIKRSY